jgi:hypothetical protein
MSCGRFGFTDEARAEILAHWKKVRQEWESSQQDAKGDGR